MVVCNGCGFQNFDGVTRCDGCGIPIAETAYAAPEAAPYRDLDGGYAPAPRVSAIPKVVGILMIIFAGLGLIQSIMAFSILAIAVSVLHLVAGVKAVGYKSSAPGLAIAYGVTALLLNVIGLFIIFGALRGELGGLLGPYFILVTFFSMAWPITAMVLMTRPAARAACSRF